MKHLHWAAIVVFACAGSALGQMNIISLDGTRTSDENESGGPRYLTAPAMRSATNSLLSAGFTIQTRPSFVGVTTQDACVLYTGTVNVDFTAQEIADTLAYVNSGGGLIIQRDWNGFYAASDPLLAAFGVTINSGPAGIPGTPTDVLQTAPHPIWSGPAGTVTGFSQGYSSFITGGASIIGVHDPLVPNGGTDALGVLNFGAGRVVILTDMDAWDEFDLNPYLTDPRNEVVWVNMFDWACTVPAPSSLALLGLGSLLIRRRR